MNKNDKKRFAVILAGIAETFEVTLSETRIGIYFEALSDMSLGQVQEAGSHLARSTGFPKPWTSPEMWRHKRYRLTIKWLICPKEIRGL